MSSSRKGKKSECSTGLSNFVTQSTRACGINVFTKARRDTFPHSLLLGDKLHSLEVYQLKGIPYGQDQKDHHKKDSKWRNTCCRMGSDVIYNVSRNLVFDVTSIILIREKYFLLSTIFLFPGPVFCTTLIIQLGWELVKSLFREHTLGHKLGNKRL